MSTFSEIIQKKPSAGVLEKILNISPEIALLGEMVFCNTSSSSDFIRVGICFDPTSVPSCTTDLKMFIFHDVEVLGNSTFTASPGIKIPKGANMYIYSQNGDIAFTIYLTKIAS